MWDTHDLGTISVCRSKMEFTLQQSDQSCYAAQKHNCYGQKCVERLSVVEYRCFRSTVRVWQKHFINDAKVGRINLDRLGWSAHVSLVYTEWLPRHTLLFEVVNGWKVDQDGEGVLKAELGWCWRDSPKRRLENSGDTARFQSQWYLRIPNFSDSLWFPWLMRLRFSFSYYLVMHQSNQKCTELCRPNTFLCLRSYLLCVDEPASWMSRIPVSHKSRSSTGSQYLCV